MFIRRLLACAAILGMFPTPATHPSAGRPAQQNALSAQTRTGAAAHPDGGWPRAYSTTSGGHAVLYEPQVVSWADQKEIVMYAAVAYTPAAKQATALGTVRLEADTKVALEERLVSFSDFKIASANFPTLSHDQVARVLADIESAVPRDERVIGLDRVLAAVDTSEIKPKNAAGVKADPPVIFFSQQPAVLVNIDGRPIWSVIKDSELRFAVNTNWDLIQHQQSRTYFLRVDHAFMTAPAVEGPWTRAGALPQSFSALPNDDNWKDVRGAVVTHLGGAPVSARAVFVSMKPAELIVLRGAPAYTRVDNTNLLWVSNTDSDVFRMGNTGPVYYLVSGRWFNAPDFAGPWTFATPTLPDDFKRIPVEHPRSRVLASVPGTTQALEAVLLTQVPQTARVSRSEVSAPDVIYQGEPQFELIDTTAVARAVNTDKQILKLATVYYMCVDGIWFTSTTAKGPWSVASEIPKEIYDIPISSPAYQVTHVRVESADDAAVVFETDPAYLGMMVSWGCAVWGTGYYYDPYYWDDLYYPVYYPWYPSYGYGAYYNPWTGAYTRAGAAYGPYGGAGYAARYNPRTGTYARGAAAWGPGGARGTAQAWNPRTGTIAQTRQGANVYGRWGTTAVQRGDQWARSAHVTNSRTGTTTRALQGSAGNVYAGRDGNVYRNQNGGWQKYSDGQWQATDRPVGTTGDRAAAHDRVDQGLSTTTRAQLDRDRAARADGARRTSDLGRVTSGSSRGGAGTYRPSGGMPGGGMRGGGMRGGGGRR